MGNDFDNSKLIKICTIGGDDNIIHSIFPYSMNTDENVQYYKRNLHKNIEAKDHITGKSEIYKIFWESYNFPELTKDNRNEFIETIFYKIFEIPKKEKEKNLEISKENEKKEKKHFSNNNIIIVFGANNADFLLNCTYLLTRLYLPQIAVITNDNIDGIQDNRFLTIIKNNDEQNLYKKIFNYLWEKECYFNQRGHLINEYSPENIIPSKDLPSSSLNIMLTGMSRSGKSTLINILSEKFVSLETPELISVTQEIREYIIYKEIKEEGNKNGLIKMKFIDTPGLNIDPDDKKNERAKNTIKSLEKKIKEFEDTNETIHIIYFFMPDRPNLEQSKIFFEYLDKFNNERINNNLSKLPILFVFNCKPNSTNKDALKKFLKDYDNLYEEGEIINKEENLSISQELNLLNEDNIIIEDNIIELDLLEEKIKNKRLRDVTYGKGLSDLLKATKYFIKKRNPFNKQDFDKIKYYIKEFKNYNLIEQNGEKLTKEQEKNFQSLKIKCKDLMIKISQENNLLSKLSDENEIIKKAKDEAYKTIYVTSSLGFLAGMIPVPLLDIPILYPMYYGMITKIGNCFSVKYSEIPNSVYFRLMFGLGADVQSSAKIVGNGVASASGKNLGKDLIYDIGEEQLIDWSKNGLHVVKSGGNVNIGEVAENLLIKNESKFDNFITYILNLFPSFNKGVKNGIEAGGQQLGKQLENVLIENTSNLSKDFVSEASERFGKVYGEKLVGNAGGYLKNITPKIIPIVGSLIGGGINFYSTYNIGKDSIKYFEDYVKKTMCCEFILKRKEEYENILNYLDIMADNIPQEFKINVVD